MGLLISLLITAGVIMLVDKLMDSMTVDGPVAALKVAILNSVILTVLLLIIPQTVLTAPFGIFGSNAWAFAELLLTFVISGLSLKISDHFLTDFSLGDFKSALLAAFLIAFLGGLVHGLLGM